MPTGQASTTDISIATSNTGDPICQADVPSTSKTEQSILKNASSFVLIMGTASSFPLLLMFPVFVYRTVTFDSAQDVETRDDRPYADVQYSLLSFVWFHK